MSEWGTLARRLRAAQDRGEPVVVAMVVATDGSAYRRAGAWMTVAPDGGRHGLLSGGCLEADVAERAAEVLASGVPTTVTYDTRRPGDVLWGFGMGCQGVVRILLEPLSGASLGRAAELYGRLQNLEANAVLAVDIASGSRVLVAGSAPGDGEPGAPPEAAGRAREILATGAAVPSIEEIGEREFAFLPVAPRPRLVICGAGEDAVPLARLACDLDWSVLVVDHRAALARPERFPGADVALVARGTDLPARIGARARTGAVVMSHNLERDVEWTAALLPLDLAYLGLLGPKRRGEQVLRTAAPLASGPARARRILAPVGLDIASETPGEIALSIVAEISAVLAGRSGGHLAATEAPIHRESSAPADPRPKAVDTPSS
ncbi:MAG: XdhC family protein [Acidobacteriota bacterium]